MENCVHIGLALLAIKKLCEKNSAHAPIANCGIFANQHTVLIVRMNGILTHSQISPLFCVLTNMYDSDTIKLAPRIE